MTPKSDATDASGASIAPIVSIGLSRDDSLARTGRLILRHEWAQVEAVDWRVEEGATLSTGQVHRLRVFTRRLRSILRVFKPYYKEKAVQPIFKGMRDLTAALTQAREQDVTVQALKSYQQSVDAETGSRLQTLLDAWQHERDEVHTACARYLGSEQYATWVRTLAAFVQSDKADRALQAGQPYYLRHMLDVIVAEHLAAVRAYDALPPQPHLQDIHNLRIEVKRLRCLCETLQDVLPAERAEAIINACIQAQHDFGELVDARLSAQRALRFVAERRVPTDDPQTLRAVLSFAQSQQQVVDQHLAEWKCSIQPLLML